ncbi:mitochondrial carrier [Phellopilus nigrolimitatus]|nr:mitochondrial carrier [Phellopilus nigrolimitatus]
MTSTLPPVVQAFSGALGSAVANATSYPLDLVCTRLQTSAQGREEQGVFQILKSVVSDRGVSGLYDGLETDTAATLVSNFFYFYAYSFLRALGSKRRAARTDARSATSNALSALEELGAGFLAGVASRAVSAPLSLITVRLQSEREAPTSSKDDSRAAAASAARVVRHIYAEGGLSAFWRGFKTTALLCLNPAATLFLFQAFRRVFLRGKDRLRPSPRQAFVGAALSNVIAVALLYPLVLAKTRLQSARTNARAASAAPRPRSMCDVWRAAYAREGGKGLYRGLAAQLVKGFVNQGLTMMTKQRIEQLVVGLYLYRTRSRAAVRLHPAPE